jgi:acyl carrier protein
MTTNTQTAQTLTDEIIDLLITEHGAPADITADTAFEALELDSLVLLEIAVVLSQRYDVVVADDELQEAGSVAGSIELLRAKGVQV